MVAEGGGMAPHAQPNAAFPAEGARGGDAAVGGGGERGQARAAPKSHPRTKILKELYDFGDSGAESEGALKKLAKSKTHHPADDDIAEWMRQVRKRAEEKAETKWRRKFEAWQHAEGRSASRRPKAGGEAAGAPEQDADGQEETLNEQELRHKLEASERRLEQLREAHERLGKDFQMEQERSAALEWQLRQACTERDAWRGRAVRHGDRLNKAALDRRRAASKVAGIGRLLQELASCAPRDVKLPDMAESGVDPIPECSEALAAAEAAKHQVQDVPEERHEEKADISFGASGIHGSIISGAEVEEAHTESVEQEEDGADEDDAQDMGQGELMRICSVKSFHEAPDVDIPPPRRTYDTDDEDDEAEAEEMAEDPSSNSP